MKRRVHKIANFFAFNLLFFALYLNFIHKDQPIATAIEQATASVKTSVNDNTTLVNNPEKYLEQRALLSQQQAQINSK